MCPRYWLNCKWRPDFDTLITTLPFADEPSNINTKIFSLNESKKGFLYNLLPQKSLDTLICATLD